MKKYSSKIKPNYEVSINGVWKFKTNSASEVRKIITFRGLNDTHQVRSPRGLDCTKLNEF